MRRTLLVLLVVLTVVGLMGCNSNGENDEPSENSTPEPYQIALVMKTLTNPFFVEMERGARQAEAEFGIELLVRTAAQETSIEQQIAIVDELIRDEIDAIVIAPGDSVRLIPVLKRAQDAGIVIVNIDNRLDAEFAVNEGLEMVPFISVDNTQGAYLSARYIIELLEAPTEMIVLEGIRDAQNAQDRHAGALQAIEENDNAMLVASETANWKIDEGYEVTAQLLEEYPEVGAIFAANDMMALGAIQYLEENDRTDVLVAAYDALDEAKRALESGMLTVTIDQQAAQQGYLGIEYAVRALQGETMPTETLIDVLVIDRDAIQ